MTSFYEELHKAENINDEKENAQSRQAIDKWIFRLLVVLIGVMPLIVLASIEQVISPVISNSAVLSSGDKGELFTHYKSLFVILIAVITSVMLLMKVFFLGGTIRKTAINYALGIFVVGIVVSTILSPNITIALNGQYNRSDGAIMWLSYIALFFVAMNIEYPKKVVNYVMYALVPFVYINLLVILNNFLGNDLLEKSWVQNIVLVMLPEGAGLSGGSQLVGTLNQWNYMSGMFAIMTIMYLAWAFVEKSWVNTVIGAVTAAAAISIMFMSISTSGFLTVVVSLVVLIVIAIKSPAKKNMAVALLLFLVIAMPVFHLLASKNDVVWRESFGFMISSNPYTEQADKAAYFPDFSMNKAYASDAALELPVLPEQGWSAGTGRTYIWSKTLDLVKEKPLFGYGLDSLMYNFPHYNIDARGGNNNEQTIVDKPHNVYIGILYGTGIIGAIGFLLLLLIAAYSSMKYIFKKADMQSAVLFSGVVAFCIQAMFNDSIPGVTTVMFVVMGMLMSLAISNQQDEAKN